MDLTQLTLETFMCVGASSMAEDRPDTFDQDKTRLQSFIGPLIRHLNEDYTLYHLNTGQGGDVGIVCKGVLIAFYVDQTIAVSENYQGKALSIPMILEGSKSRSLPSSRSHTAAGKKAFEKAWRVANGFERNPWP